jgi:raffinose/stachyose/melibiose transport system permease protein
MNRSEIVAQLAKHDQPSRLTSIGSSTRIERVLAMLFSQVALIFFTLLILYPVLWMVFASFKTKTEIVTNVWGLPQQLAWENYVNAWQSAELGYALVNSVITSVSVVVLIVIFASLAGFAFAKLRFPGITAIFLAIIFTMHAPAPVIPLYVLLVRLGLTDSRIGLILPMVAGGLPLAMFIFRAYFQSIPTELLDAARVDGCTDLGAFIRVVMPISGPAIATVAILQFVGAWNEYFLALVLLRTAEMRTVPLAIQVFFYAWGRTEWQEVFAALVIASLPMIVLYIVLQRQFIQGLTAGSIKG